MQNRSQTSKILLLATAFILPFISCTTVQAKSVVVDRVIAVVNDDVIMESEFFDRMRSVQRQLREKDEPVPISLETLRSQVLERLIVENLQLQMARKGSIRISNREVNEAVAKLAAKNGMNLEEFSKAMAEEGESLDILQRNLRKELTITRLQKAVINGRVNITEQQITDFINSEEGKRRSGVSYRLAHISLPFSPDATDEDKQGAYALAKDISDRAIGGEDFATLASQYSKSGNAQMGGELGWRRKTDLPVSYSIAVDELEKGDISSPVLSETGYHVIKLIDKRGSGEQMVTKTRVRHILTKTNVIRNDEEAKAYLLDLKKRIEDGEKFEDLAREYSEDYTSALRGGELDWVMPGQLVRAFDTVMASSAPNVISAPFQSQFGWHILEVLERKSEDVSNDVLRMNARNLLFNKRFSEELPSWLKEIRDEAFIDIKVSDYSIPQ
jgi:peptidyl-prolyl cis-trans isomerase SurA